MNKLKEFYSLEKPSIVLLVLPFIAISWDEIYNIGFFTYPKMGLVFLMLILCDFAFKVIIKPNSKLANYFAIGVVTAVIMFFYSSMFALLGIQLLKNVFYTLTNKMRWFLLFIFLIILFIQLLSLKKIRVVYKFVNYFTLIFFFLILGTKVLGRPKNISEIKNSFIAIKTEDTIQKPILLIITDEYSSPDELYKIIKDSSVYNYSNNLEKQGWVTKNKIYSHEIYTMYSLSSMFNFNLSASKDYSIQSIDVVNNEFLECDLYDSIQKKQGKIINFGFFNFGNSKPLATNSSLVPKNFVEQFFKKSIYSIIKAKMSGINSNHLYANYNEMVFNETINNTIQDDKTFLYAHLLFPHSPFFYNKEFGFREDNTNNYIAFWNFCNTKTTQLLKVLTKEDKYRIIVTGDHGYRADKRINPHFTFTAFWGFNEEDINQIRSVQDLGSLINGYVF